MMLICLKHFFLLFYLGSAWALFGFRSIYSNTVVENREFVGNQIKVKMPEAELSFKNTPYVYIKTLLSIRGSVVLRSDRFATGNFENLVRYSLAGALINRKLFIVHHNNSEIPLEMDISAGTKWGSRIILSCNYGDMVLLSNGPAEMPNDKEFHIDLNMNFHNKGSISVLGTTAHTAQMRVKADRPATMPPSFLNKGIIYLKNAIFHQEAHFNEQGCIALDKGTTFVANAEYKLDYQVIDFLRGVATLFIKSSGKVQTKQYTVTTFQRGSRIRFEPHMTKWKLRNNDVIVSSALDDTRVVVTFEHYQRLDPEQVRFKRGVLTYRGEFTRIAPDWRCKNVHNIAARAKRLEIKA